MRLSLLLGALSIALAGVASAQGYNEAAQPETRTATISGHVVSYEPGRVIVIRGTDGKEVSYPLSPRITVPADVQVGQKVTVYTERSASGSPTTVSRIATTSLTPEGKVKVTTDETRTTAAGKVTRKHTTTISGVVVKYEPGQTIIVREPSRKVATYRLAPDASVPPDIQVGKMVTLYAEPGADGGARTVKRVTTTTTTTTELSGRVEAYTAGKSITMLRSDGSRVTYSLTSQSSVPADLVIGKTITIVPINPRENVAQTITIREP